MNVRKFMKVLKTFKTSYVVVNRDMMFKHSLNRGNPTMTYN